MKGKLLDTSLLWDLVAFDDGSCCIVSLDGRVGCVFEIGGVDPGPLDEAGAQHVMASLETLIAGMPEGWLFRFHAVNFLGSNVTKRQLGRALSNTYLAAISYERARNLDNNDASRPMRLFVSMCSPETKKQGFFKAKNSISNIDDGHIKQLQTEKNRVETALRQSGLGPQSLDIAATYELMCGLYRPGKSPKKEDKITEDLLGSSLLRLPIQSAPSWVFSGSLQRVMAVSRLPRWVKEKSIWDLQSIPCDMHTVVTLSRLDSDKATASLEASRRRSLELQRLRGKFRGQDAACDPDAADMVVQIEDMLACIASGDPVCRGVIQCRVIANGAKELEAASSAACDAMASIGQAEMFVEDFRQEEAMSSMIPGNEGLLGDRFELLLSSRLVRLLPIFAPRKGSPEPDYVLRTEPSDPWGWNTFCPTRVAHNAVVMSSTGSGKSFVVRCLHLPHFLKGGRGVIVTSGQDYNTYAQAIGGASIQRIDPEDGQLALGPLVSKQAFFSSQENSTRQIADVLLVMSENVDAPVSRRRRLASELIEFFYKTTTDEQPTLHTLAAMPVDGLVLDDDESETVHGMLRCIRDWLRSSCGPALLRPRQDKDAKILVYDIEPIRNDLEMQRLVLALITADIDHMIDSGPTVIILDECWKILSSDTGSYLAANLYRTVRKRGSSVWSISQSVQDWLELPGNTRQAILSNTSIEVFLALKPLEASSVVDTFAMNEAEARLLYGLKSVQGFYSDILIAVQNHRQLIQMVPTGTELWLATSDAIDVSLRKKYAEKYPQLSPMELAWALGRKFPHGAPRDGGRAS